MRRCILLDTCDEIENLHRKTTWPWKVKLSGLSGSASFCMLLAHRSSGGHFVLMVFFHITHDRLSERGTTHSLQQDMQARIPLTHLPPPPQKKGQPQAK